MLPYRRLSNYKVRKLISNGVFLFLGLPRELRDIIISYAIDFNGINGKISEANNSFPIPNNSKSFYRNVHSFMKKFEANPIRSTPSILLLNHQIYEEANEMLQRKTLEITTPPRYPIDRQLGLFSFISEETLENICKASFSLCTYPVSTLPISARNVEMLLAPDWRGKGLLGDELLADSFPWAMLLKHCVQIWWRSQKLKCLTISIHHSAGNQSEYNLSVSRVMLSAFENCMSNCLYSMDLDKFVAFLIFASVPC